MVQPEASKAGLDGLAGRQRRRVQATTGGVVDELAGDDEPVAPAGDRLSQERLVVPRAIAGGRIEEGDAEIDRAVDGPDGFRVDRRSVDIGQTHGPEALGADGQ